MIIYSVAFKPSKHYLLSASSRFHDTDNNWIHNWTDTTTFMIGTSRTECEYMTDTCTNQGEALK